MKKIICITLLAFAATCKIVPHNPVVPGDETYQPPTLQFNENSIKDGDTIASDEAVWFFTGSLGDRNQYRYKLDNNNWSEWQKVKNIGTEVRLMFTRADTGKHIMVFESCYHPNNKDFRDTSFSFVKINTPLILIGPSDLVVTEGQVVSFNVAASGTNLSYQWQKDTVNIEGATSSMLSIPAVALGDNNTRYRCIVYNIGGLTVTNYAKLSVNKKIIPPLIATQPENQSVTEGQSVTFAVTATGTDISYQWKKGNSNINGAYSPSYTIIAATLADSGATFTCVISNNADTVSSNNVILSVQKKIYPPVITIQPLNQTVTEGQPVTFTISAAGTDLHYQWRKGKTKISNATSSTFTIAAVSVADNNALLSCIVSNSVDTITSNEAVLSVVQNVIAPAITVQPISSSITEGKSALFTVVATGTELHYQWYKDTSAIQSAVSSTYTIPLASLEDNEKSFKCMVYNSVDTVMSSIVKLTVTKNVVAPAITMQPQNKAVTEGQPSTFIIEATGTDLKYQWQKNNVAIAGATTNTYIVATSLLTDNGAIFHCVVFNNADTISSNAATLSVIQNILPPVITVQPIDQTVIEGQTVTFTITATGTALVYQWQKGATPISSATSATFSLQNVVLSDNGSEYSCIVSNAIDTVESRKVKLIVTQNIVVPSIIVHPVAATIKVGSKATFTITASGTNLSYQWQKDSTDISNATSPTYTTAVTAASDDGSTYRCIIKNSGGADTSASAALTIEYFVVYDGNGNTGGTVPTDATTYAKGETVTVQPNSGALARMGYTFSGWNTKADTSGTNYTAGTGSFKMESANVTLYAKWPAISYPISYYLNSGENSINNPKNYTIETPTITLTAPVRTGYTFGGWYSSEDLSGNAVTTITKGSTGNKILYAKWTPTNPTIITQPGDVTADAGDTVSFSISASGPAGTTLSYQWQKNGADITDGTGTSAILTLGYVTKNDSSSQYRCVINTSAGGKVTSSVAVLKVVSIKVVSAGYLYTMILKTDGTLWGTGLNGPGQLGIGSTVSVSTPVQIMSGVASISTGPSHTMIVKTDGTLWATGANNSGQLGNGTTTNVTTPVQVMSSVLSADVGLNHTMIVKTDGTLWATGNNGSGQLGSATTTNVTTPAQVMNSVIFAAVGLNHTMVIKTDGTLWVTGDNRSGQSGLGSSVTAVSAFEQLLSGITSVNAGDEHTMIVKADGTLWATGSNGSGQLGNGNTTSRSIANQVMSSVASVSAGGSHTMLIKTDGTLWATGSNSSGQLGNGSTANISTPVQVNSGIASVAAGFNHTMIVKNDGTLWATGDNSYGQLGNGTKTSVTTPVHICF